MSNERSATNGLHEELAALRAENESLRQQVKDMHQNQERLHYALEGSSDGMWDWLIRDNQAVLSDRYREMLGYSPDELPDSVDSWMHSIHPDDMPIITSTVEEYLAGQREEYLVEHRLLHKSGEWRWMLSRGKIVVRDENGQPLRMTGTITDITERKERELSERQLSTLIEASSDFISFAMLDGKAGYVNPAGRRLLGMGLDQDIATLSMEQFHLPEDIAFLHETILPAVYEHGEWRGEFRFRHFQTGDSVAISFMLFQVTNPHTGQIDRLGCFARDITEQKRQQAEVSIFKTMADTAPDGFGMADADGTLTYANDAYKALTGYGDALVGMNFLDHFTEADRVVALEALRTTAEQGDWQGVLNFQQQDGSIIPVDTKGFVTRDEAGNIAAVMGLFRDLTEQYRQEEERAILQQQVIDAQRDALRELSTPLIPISDDVVIMPLIGTIDSGRAQQVMETLLEGVAQHQATLVILDITGVSVVDTQVAQSFMHAAQAVRLLGAQVMLTGIQPQIAQTLVHLGVDLGGIQTQSSLQAGIAAALTSP